MLDFNDADDQRSGGVIPDGSFVKVRLTILPGGTDGFDPGDEGLLTKNKAGDLLMLNCEYSVLYGPYRGRKFWKYFTVAGLHGRDATTGARICKEHFKAALNSAQLLDPQDMTEGAMAKRRVPNFKMLDGMEYTVKLGVESDDYGDKNKIVRVIVKGDPEYATVMDGGDVPPKPTKARTPKAAAPQKPAWESAGGGQVVSGPAHWTPAGTQTPTGTTHPTGSTPPSWLQQ